MIAGVTIAVIVIVAIVLVGIFMFMKGRAEKLSYSSTIASFSDADHDDEFIDTTTTNNATIDNPLVSMSVIDSIELQENNYEEDNNGTEYEYVYEEFDDFFPI